MRLPDVNVGVVEVDFSTAMRRMNGGIIKVEEVDGTAFTLTSLDPMDGKNFTITGATTAIGSTMMEQNARNSIYDLTGRQVGSAGKGVYIVNGRKVLLSR